MVQVSRLLLVCWCSVVLLGPSGSSAQDTDERPLWGDLDPGEYAVGFRSFWSFDVGRIYARPEAGLTREAKFPRPVLVNLWYPAAATNSPPMLHGDYLDIEPEDERLTALAAELSAYALEVISEETLRASGEDLDDEGRAKLKRLLATPTAAMRDAESAAGPFPLVLYHAGYGSSFEDNAVLCEYLASHGYVVAGSAFQEGDGASFNIDADRDSEADLSHLVRIASGVLPVDTAHVGMVGHSGGAHTAVRYISRVSTPISAMVSLDTTQDYHSFADRRWDDMVPVALENADHIDMPVLFAARQHAMFRMADRLEAAGRVYLTFTDLEHNSFIAQGVIAAEVQEEPAGTAIRARYNELCHGVLLFFDSALREDPVAAEALRSRWAGSAPGVSPVFIECVAPGETVKAYDDSSGLPPTPRQVAAMLDSGDAQRVGELLVRFRDHSRARPFADVEFAISVLFQLVHEGRETEAVAMLPCFATEQSEILRIVGALESMYSRIGADRLATPYAEMSQVLAPETSSEPP